MNLFLTLYFQVLGIAISVQQLFSGRLKLADMARLGAYLQSNSFLTQNPNAN
jgi:hypothetical protein